MTDKGRTPLRNSLVFQVLWTKIPVWKTYQAGSAAFEQVDEFVKLKQKVTRTMVDSILVSRGGGMPDHGELQEY